MPAEQTMILVDEDNNVIGYAPRSECHTGKGKRHRAFVILLYNKDKKILLQHRKHRVFDKLWDLAGASHPLHVDGRDQDDIEASLRCLRDEWGIEKAELRKIGSFNYFKQDENRCENEYCYLIVGEYDDELKINPDVAYGFRWVSLEQLLSEIEEKPEIFTEWLLEAVKILEKSDLGRELLS